MASWLSAVGNATPLYSFVSVEGTPLPSFREYREVSREGVDGIGHYVGGTKGQPFQLKTFLDAANLAAAKTQQAAYRSHEGSLLDLYWQSNLFGTVFVYEAQPEPVEVLMVSVGGINNGLAVCPTTWKLRVIS